MDRQRFDADPDPTFHSDADPDPDPTLSFTHVGESEIIFTAVPVNITHLSCQPHTCNFNILDSKSKFSGKRYR